MVKQQHTRITRRIAGSKGKTEVPISRQRRLDVRLPKVAIEVERSRSPARIQKAISRLKTQPGVRRELRVPQPNMETAVEVAKRESTKITIKNLGGTRRRQVG